jgi:UDP-N-acetylmuramyl pentapeptide phosphotransferase/UDP-N-acetylglucosamine-1-phosphate transferase
VTGAGAGFVSPVVTALGLSAVLVPALERWARRRGVLDRPNARSSHSTPTPRLGGVGIVAALAGGLIVVHHGLHPIPDAVALLAGALVLAAMSLMDDLRSLSPMVRLAGQTAVAIWLVSMTHLADGVPGWVPGAIVPAIIAIVWVLGLVNAYNFMDGIDGLAGGQALVAGLGWAAIGALVRDPLVVATGLVLAGAVVPFLWLNWHPARIFMGDAGSAVLGLSFALVPLVAGQRHPHMLVIGSLLVWPFIFDTAFTLVRRLRRGENIVQAHRTHLYQRLVAAGLSHAQVTLVYLGLAGAGVPGAALLALGHLQVAGGSGLLVVVAAVAIWQVTARREHASVEAHADPGGRG